MNNHLSVPGRASSVGLIAEPGAVSCARAFLRLLVTQWGAGGQVDDAELVLSELVTNALRATRADRPAPEWPATTAADVIRVGLGVTGGGLYVGVWDRSRAFPVVRHPGDGDEGGRGLRLVDALAREWGATLSRAGGKVVWATLAAPGGDTPDTRLPDGDALDERLAAAS